MAKFQKSPVQTAAAPKAGPSVGLGQFKAEVEKKAKEIYLKRQETKAPGDALSDWLGAEKEIKAKYRIS